jgi:hypothetical protein
LYEPPVGDSVGLTIFNISEVEEVICGVAIEGTGLGCGRVQSGARRHGIGGIHGSGGNVESAT